VEYRKNKRRKRERRGEEQRKRLERVLTEARHFFRRDDERRDTLDRRSYLPC